MTPWLRVTLSIIAGSCVIGPVRAADVRATYVTDLIANVDGGIQRGSAWLGRGDLTIRDDTDALGIAGLSASFDLLLTHGPDFSGRFPGDAQIVSNVQAQPSVRPYEAWLSLPLNDRTRMKAGLIDLNTEFDVHDVAGLFLNSAHGVGSEFSQSGRAGPSIYPATSTALVLTWAGADTTFRLGAFDAVAGQRSDPRRVAVRLPGQAGALLVAEAEFKLPRQLAVQFGAWRYTARFDPIDPLRAPPRPTSHGVYVLAEKSWQLGQGNTVQAWIRGGQASAQANAIAFYTGGGLTFGNDLSRIGIAVAHARLGAPARRTHANRAETAVELTWRRRLTGWLTVQPNVQYVVHPGWEQRDGNAVVTALRLIFET